MENMISNKQIIKIFCLQSQRLPFRKIAKRLGISPTTVNTYIHSEKFSYIERINNAINPINTNQISADNTLTIESVNSPPEQIKESVIDLDQLISSKLADLSREQIDPINKKLMHL